MSQEFSYAWFMSHMGIGHLYVTTHDPFSYVTWIICLMSHDSCLIHMSDSSYIWWVMTHVLWAMTLMGHGTHHVLMSHSCEWDMSQDSRTIPICDMNHMYDESWVMSHSHECHGWVMSDHMKESCHTYEWITSHVSYQWVMSHTWMSHVTHVNESCHTYEWVMSHHINDS